MPERIISHETKRVFVKLRDGFVIITIEQKAGKFFKISNIQQFKLKVRLPFKTPEFN